MEDKNILNDYLNKFAQYENKYPGIISDSITFNFSKHKGHIVYGSIIHGNEVGSLPAVIELIEQLASGKLKYQGKVSFFLGNKKAALQKMRYTEYDLNRSFGENIKESQTHERNRAKKIMQLLNTADVFIDFHQTTKPSLYPFYIFSMHEESYYWAQAAGVAEAFITRKPGSHFSSAGMCSDEYTRLLNKVGITIELGEQGFHELAKQYAKLIMLRSLNNMDKVFNKLTSIKNLAQKNNLFHFYATTYKEPFLNPKKSLKKGYCNFNFISKGECIGTDENNEPLICKKDGYILFPKYPDFDENGKPRTPLPGELFVLAEKLNFHPLNWIRVK